MFITNSPAPSRINSAELPQRDVTVWEIAIFGYFPCIIRTVRTRSFNHKHKHRKMAIFCYFFSRFFCSLNWEFSYSNWEKNILFGIGNTTEYRSSKRAKKNPALEYSMTLKLQTEHHLKCLSLKGGCTGSSASTLVKIPHGWKSNVAAHLLFVFFS